jgi:hypothetical protein
MIVRPPKICNKYKSIAAYLFMMICTFNHNEPPSNEFKSLSTAAHTHIYISNDLPIYTCNELCLVWKGILYNSDTLKKEILPDNKKMENDVDLIFALYDTIGRRNFNDMLRLLNAEFTHFFLLDSHIYSEERVFYVATNMFDLIPSCVLYIQDGVHITSVKTTDNDSLLTVPAASFLRWTKTFQVCSEWSMEPQVHCYYQNPIPLEHMHMTNIQLETFMLKYVQAAILKKWTAVGKPTHICFSEKDRISYPPLFASMQQFLENNLKCTTLVLSQNEYYSVQNKVFFCIAKENVLKPFLSEDDAACNYLEDDVVYVFPFFERDIYQIMCLFL